MSNRTIVKPVEHIEKLVQATSIPSRIRKGVPRQIFQFQQYTETAVFCLIEGTVGMYRRENQQLVAHIDGPCLLGANFMLDLGSNIYLKARGDITYEVIPSSEFKKTIEEKNLWEHYSYQLMFVFMKIGVCLCLVTENTALKKIHISLQELSLESDSIRLTMTACDYIQERTLLSRSGIMKVLGDLKNSGAIKMKKGVLLEMSDLPND